MHGNGNHKICIFDGIRTKCINNDHTKQLSDLICNYHRKRMNNPICIGTKN